MRIVLYTETFLPHVDGMVTRLTHTLTCLARMGDEALVIAPALDGLPREFAGAQVLGAPSMVVPMYRDLKFGYPALFPSVRDAIRRFQPDLIHVANPFLTDVGGVLYARQTRTPLVASFHTQVPEYVSRYHLGWLRRPLWRLVVTLHQQADLNLCTSRPMQALLAERGVPRLALWAPGVDTARFTPGRRSAAWRERLTGGRPDATILLYVGRLAPEKSLEWLRPVMQARPDCHLAFVGAGPEGATLRRSFGAEAGEARERVTFVGPLAGDDLAAAYASADIFTLPSTTETLGLAAIEAMASGLPVVGARRGGIPDIIVEGETGALFDPDTPPSAPAALLRALTPLIEDVGLRRRMGAAALARARGWSWEASSAGLRRHYRDVLEARGRRHCEGRAAVDGEAVGEAESAAV